MFYAKIIINKMENQPVEKKQIDFEKKNVC